MRKEFLQQFCYRHNKYSLSAFVKRIYFSIRNRFLIEPTIFLNKNPRYQKWEIGDFTYSGREGCPDVIEGDQYAHLKIGKFCSIAYNVTFFLGGHRTDWVSTYPFSVLFDEAAHINGHPVSKGNITVGHDVWIGKNASIFSGVNIGNGAVIAANSVVTKDVPSYSIVGGNPARIIKMRYDEETIEKLEGIQWWNWDIRKVLANVELLLNADVSKFVTKHSLNKDKLVRYE
jgi:virginiamycin A acetyltransferase